MNGFSNQRRYTAAPRASASPATDAAPADARAVSDAAARFWGTRARRFQVADDRVRCVVYDLFHVTFAVASEEVEAAISGWDTDLSSALPTSRRPLADAAALVSDVDAVLKRLTPREYAEVWAARPAGTGDTPAASAPATGVASVDRVADALSARAARERGEDPVQHVDLAGLRRLATETWPDAEWIESWSPSGEAWIESRPYGTHRISLGIEPPRGLVTAAIFLDDEALVSVLGRRLPTNNNVSAIRNSIATMDEWLRLTRAGAPPSAKLIERHS
jgi:hypothetical protein